MPSKRLQEVIAGQRIQSGRPTRVGNRVPLEAQYADPELAQLHRDVVDSVDGVLVGTPFKEGRLLTLTFTISSLVQEVPHKLNGPAKGAFVVDNVPVSTAGTVVREDMTSGGAPAKGSRLETHVKLRATTECTAQVWVWR